MSDIKIIDGKPYVFHDGAFHPVTETPAATPRSMKIADAVRSVVWEAGGRILEALAISRVAALCAPGTTEKQVLNGVAQLQSEAREIAIWPPHTRTGAEQRDWSITPKFKVPDAGSNARSNARRVSAPASETKPKGSTQAILYQLLADDKGRSIAECREYVAANGGCTDLHAGHVRIIPNLLYDKDADLVFFIKPENVIRD